METMKKTVGFIKLTNNFGLGDLTVEKFVKPFSVGLTCAKTCLNGFLSVSPVLVKHLGKRIFPYHCS